MQIIPFWVIPRRLSLRTRLIHLYGEETTRHIRLFEKLRIKKTKLLNSLTFLLRCRDHRTIPRFVQFQYHFHSRAANRIYQCTNYAKPSQAKVLTGGGDLREAQVDVPLSVSHSCV